jgi:hypothetical protein
MTQRAALRVCASCEWIYHRNESGDCPQCKFGSYGARAVYGDKCYDYARTQKPWYERKMANYSVMLDAEIRARAIAVAITKARAMPLKT